MKTCTNHKKKKGTKTKNRAENKKKEGINMGTCTKEELESKVLATPELREALKHMNVVRTSEVGDVIPENQIARAILTEALRSKEIANTIFARAFEVESVCWCADSNHSSTIILLKSYTDCTELDEEMSSRKQAGDVSRDLAHAALDILCKRLMEDALEYEDAEYLGRLRKYCDLKNCHRAIDNGDAVAAKVASHRLRYAWKEVGKNGNVPILFAALADLFALSDMPETLSLALGSLTAAAFDWPETLPTELIPDSLKGLI